MTDFLLNMLAVLSVIISLEAFSALKRRFWK